MENPKENYWRVRLEAVKQALEENRFGVYIVENAAATTELVMETILPALGSGRIAWGGSLTFTESGLYDRLKNESKLDILDTFDKTITREEQLERRRQALLADFFITGTNAVTENGQLVNLDMIGNRVAALTFGPRHVIVLVGRNKIVADVDGAVARIKNYAAPVNTMRLDKKTPCAKTGWCEECRSPDRICNTWTITEKSFPPKRITIVLINQDLGF